MDSDDSLFERVEPVNDSEETVSLGRSLDTIKFIDTPQIAEWIVNGADFQSNDCPLAIKSPKVGSRIFVVSRSTYASADDITHDAYSPWNGKSADGTLFSPKFSVKEHGNMQIRIVKSRHPKAPRFKRLVAFDVSGQGFVVYQYVFETEHILPPTNERFRRILPSEVEKVREALAKRSTRAAQSVLRDNGVNVSKKAIFNQAHNSDASLLKRGPTPTSSIDKLLSISKSNEFMRVYCCQDEDKRNVRVSVLFPKARFSQNRCQLKQNYRISAKKWMNVPKSVYCVALNVANASQYFDRVGETLMSDITFDLSDLFMTVLIGSTSKFARRDSGKCVFLTLGYMLHSNKGSEHQRAFGQFFVELASKYTTSEQRIPCFMADAELALRSFIEVESPLVEMTRIGCCDLHLRDNLLQKFGKENGQEFSSILFGKCIGKEDGSDIVKPGLLSSLNRQDFDKFMKKIADKKKEFYPWVSSRSRKLFDEHAMKSKLLDGNCARFRTTNNLECRNNVIKLIINKRLPGHMVIDAMETLHNDEMKDLLQALEGKGSIVLADSSINLKSLDELDEDDVEQIHATYGVQLPVLGMARQEVLKKTKIIRSLCAVQWPGSEGEYVVKANKVESTAFTVKKRGELFVCSSRHCQIGCVHALCAMINEGAEDNFRILRDYQVKKSREFKSTRNDAAKTKRKGAYMSKGNHKRSHLLARNGVLDTSSSANDSLTSLPSRRTSLRLQNLASPISPL